MPARSMVALSLLLCLSAPALAEPLPGEAPRPGLRRRVAQRLSALSLRAANGYRNLRDRVSPALRHGAMTVVSAGVTYASVEGLVGRGDIASPVGLLALTGVVLGTSTTLHQGAKFVRARFPEQARRLGQRLKQRPLLGPWLKDSRPWLQRLRTGLFRRKDTGD